MKKTNLTEKQKQKLEDRTYSKILKMLSPKKRKNKKVEKQLKELNQIMRKANAITQKVEDL